MSSFKEYHATIEPTPLIYSKIMEGQKNQFTNILLIDSQVKNYETFADSVNSSTFPVVYSVMSSKTELLTLLQTNFTSISRIGIVFTSSLANSKTFLDGKPLFLNPELEPYSENLQFIMNVIKEFKVKNIDYLACETLNYPNWVSYYKLLSESTGVVIGASNDRTGNMKYGGDWVMESTSQNVELVYFKQSIEYYTYLLDSTIYSLTYLTSNTAYGRNGFMFNLLPSNNIQIQSFSLYFLEAKNYNFSIYYLVGSIVDDTNASSSSNWTLLYNGNISISNTGFQNLGLNLNLTLLNNIGYAIYIFNNNNDRNIEYGDEGFQPDTIIASDSNLTLYSGYAQSTAFNGYRNLRQFLGSIYYNLSLVCFKEDTKILTDKGYIPIQDLRKGDLVKTLKHNYKAIDMIGKREVYHAALQERIKDQLYKCSQEQYPEIFEPLIITGGHSILVDSFINEEQKEKVIEVNGNTYVTDSKYRLPACADPRATVYETPGTYTIYHLALENDDYYENYGIYANGLLVETCSKGYLKEFSNMTLIE